MTTPSPDAKALTVETLQRVSDQLGEAIHVSFRKAADSRQSVDAWNAIDKMDPREWANILDFILKGLGVPQAHAALQTPAPQPEELREAADRLKDCIDSAETSGKARAFVAVADVALVLAAFHPPTPVAEGWRPIESAPRDGTLFLSCNLDHPSFGSHPTYRRVRHELIDDEWTTTDLGGWVHLHDLEPDYQEGYATGPEPTCSIAPDDLNTGVRYGWTPLPAPLPPSPEAQGEKL